jgi:hypothetical protein
MDRDGTDPRVLARARASSDRSAAPRLSSLALSCKRQGISPYADPVLHAG